MRARYDATMIEALKTMADAKTKLQTTRLYRSEFIPDVDESDIVVGASQFPRELISAGEVELGGRSLWERRLLMLRYCLRRTYFRYRVGCLIALSGTGDRIAKRQQQNLVTGIMHRETRRLTICCVRVAVPSHLNYPCCI